MSLLLVEDDLALARAITRELMSYGFQVGHHATTAVDARAAWFRRTDLAAAIIDLNLDDGPVGYELAHDLRRIRFGAMVVWSGERQGSPWRRPELRGLEYVVKSAGAEQLAVSLDRALHEGTQGNLSTLLNRLTERQREIALLLIQEGSGMKVAQSMQLAPQTVRNHLKRIYRVLGVQTQAELVGLLTR